MMSISRLAWIRLVGVMAVVLVVFSTLMLPTELERVRTGHWFLEHFVGYFAAASIILLGWPRPLLVAAVFTIAAFILEGLQFWTPTHSPALLSAIGGAAGAIAAAALAKVIMVMRTRHFSAFGRRKP
jgi:VanZ family protein